MKQELLKAFKQRAEEVAKTQCSVEHRTGLDKQGDHSEEWSCYAWNGCEILYMARSRSNYRDCLVLFEQAQAEYIQQLDQQLVRAKEAYDTATRIL